MHKNNSWLPAFCMFKVKVSYSGMFVNFVNKMPVSEAWFSVTFLHLGFIFKKRL
jgi:hypothetical protein